MSKSVLCIGATLVDELYFCKENIVSGSSNPAQKTNSIGGVMSNIVQHLALLNVPVAFLTALGSDADADYIESSFQKLGIAMTESVRSEDSTGKYVSILKPDGNLYVAVCQDISDKVITIPLLESKAEYLRSFEVIVVDTNLAKATIQWLIHFVKKHSQTLIIEPVSVTKASKLSDLDLQGVYMITPNQEELHAITGSDVGSEQSQATLLHKGGVTNVWLRKGNEGSVIYHPTESFDLGVPNISIADSTGAGDAALAGWLYGYLRGETAISCLQYGHALALKILQQKGAVDTTLTQQNLNNQKQKYYHDYK